MKWHKSQKKFKCVHCKAGYKIERNLDLHVAIVHSDGNLTKCPVCQVTFTSQRSASLKSHMMLHQIEELYTCDKCKSEFDHEVSIYEIKKVMWDVLFFVDNDLSPQKKTLFFQNIQPL